MIRRKTQKRQLELVKNKRFLCPYRIRQFMSKRVVTQQFPVIGQFHHMTDKFGTMNDYVQSRYSFHCRNRIIDMEISVGKYQLGKIIQGNVCTGKCL